MREKVAAGGLYHAQGRSPADEHVHSEFSWDTGPHASMRAACAHAVELGIPAVSFTEHVDFIAWALDDHPLVEGRRPRAPRHYQPVDVPAYLDSIERCRDEFPSLRVRAGIETGEPHLFAGSVAAVLAQGPFERVLGSLHSVIRDDELVGVNRVLKVEDPHLVMREYFAELLGMIQGSSVFDVLAHCDYPRRHWPRSAGPYSEHVFEQDYRAVFAALAASGRALEINTRSPLASVDLVRWWYEEGGRAVSFGSDAHVPWAVGQRFDLAVEVVTAAGFRPGRDRWDFYRV